MIIGYSSLVVTFCRIDCIIVHGHLLNVFSPQYFLVKIEVGFQTHGVLF